MTETSRELGSQNDLADLDEDGDHGDAVGAPGCLGVVGVQILVVMDQLDLRKHEEMNRCKGPVTVCRPAFTASAPSLSLAEVINFYCL